MGSDKTLLGFGLLAFLFFRCFFICKYQSFLLIKADDTTDDATATVPTVRLTTDTNTADGIMGITMYTSASSVVK